MPLVFGMGCIITQWVCIRQGPMGNYFQKGEKKPPRWAVLAARVAAGLAKFG
jgi:hypothetical protein